MKLSGSFQYKLKKEKELVNYGYNIRVEKHNDRNFYWAEIWVNGKINACYNNVKMNSPAMSEKDVPLWIKTFTEKLLKFVTGE